MRLLYTTIIYLILPFVLVRLIYLGFRNSDYWSKWGERFGFINWGVIDKPVIWIHAVSVGEVNAARPIIKWLFDEYKKKYQLLVTTVTPTGKQTLRQHFADDVRHLYLPYDFSYAVKRFIKQVTPQLLITMETEIWPNLYHCCYKSNIPILLVNGRLSAKSAKRYKMVSNLMRETLGKISLIAAQTTADADRFIYFGAVKENVFVTGSLKFDATIPCNVNEQGEALKYYFSANRPIWIAASTQAGEDKLILEAHLQILRVYPDAILILAPRHPERVKQIEFLCRERKLAYIKRTKRKSFTENYQVYLLDVLGELQPNYAASQLAFVGGSLVKMGGQNTLEPASLGLPVLTGPYTYNFVEINDRLFKAGGLQYVYTIDELSDAVCHLFSDANIRYSIGEKGRRLVESNGGNIKRLTRLIEPYINGNRACQKSTNL